MQMCSCDWRMRRRRIQDGIVKERETVQVRSRFVVFLTLSVLAIASSHSLRMSAER